MMIKKQLLGTFNRNNRQLIENLEKYEEKQVKLEKSKVQGIIRNEKNRKNGCEKGISKRS